MSVELPEPIADYFSADKVNADAVARCFTSNAVVKDEGHTYRGIEAIKKWRTDAAAKYHYTCEPLASQKQADTTLVTSRLAGNFPGSPVTLRYFFRLERGKIAFLEIAP